MPLNTDELFDAGFLDRLRAQFIRLRKRRQLRRKGLQPTPSTGFTREFKDFRHYTPNDDYRAIDWQLYARMGKLFIRLFEEVQEFDVHVVIDTSASMSEVFPEKRSLALKLAVALSYLGLVSQHRVNIYSFGQTVKTEIAMLKGQGNITRVLQQLAGLPFGGLTDLEKCFRDFRPARQKFGVIFLISDFFGRDLNSAGNGLIRNASTWAGESHAIQLIHPQEREPELDGELQLRDSETGELRRIWMTKREGERYREIFDDFVEKFHRACLSRRVDHVLWRTDEPFEDGFLNLLTRGSALAGR